MTAETIQDRVMLAYMRGEDAAASGKRPQDCTEPTPELRHGWHHGYMDKYGYILRCKRAEKTPLDNH